MSSFTWTALRTMKSDTFILDPVVALACPIEMWHWSGFSSQRACAYCYDPIVFLFIA